MPDLPSGTVTFLFTDIEGSTALWERDRQAMANAVHRHLGLLAAAVQAHGGIHFKTVGDATQSAFPTAPQAVAAALGGQQALLAEDWGEIGPLRVRMALHAGEAIPNDRGDYLAAPLNRLSRLLSSGYGGQILLTQTVQQLTRGALPAGAHLRDLGEHRLRDLLGPERVYQVLHPDLAATFPALKTPESRPNNLPLQPTPFLGREQEVRQIVDLLRHADVRMVTLTGPGGVGKTRLALQAAADLLEVFPDGVFVVELAPLTDASLVPSTLATVLGVREEGGQPVIAALVRFLSDRRLLLVLDNFEHLLAAAPVVSDLLRACPTIKILATSRAPLHLRGEREYPVPTLGVPDPRRREPVAQLAQYEAVRLFVDRAQAVRPDFALVEENAAAVAEICRRLDGLPLAIELAAARSRLLTPAQVLKRLASRLPFLTGGPRDLPARQQTLRTAIDWSYDLLDTAEQTLLTRLGVFRGGAALDAIEAVCPDPDGGGISLADLFDLLESLSRQSLLEVDETALVPRVRMLDTIREYALDRLAQSEGDTVATRHATYFLDLAERGATAFASPEQGDWLDLLSLEHDNVRATFDHFEQRRAGTAIVRLAGALWHFWWVRGHLLEGRDRLQRALEIGDGDAVPAPIRARALDGAGVLAEAQGDVAHAANLHEEALMLWRQVGDRLGQARALENLGLIELHDRGNARLAGEHFEGALVLYQQEQDEQGITSVLRNLGDTAAMEERFSEAAALYDDALVQARQLGNIRDIAASLTSLGALAFFQEDHGTAIRLYEESLPLWRQLNDVPGTTLTLGNLGEALDHAGDVTRAKALYAECLSLSRDQGDRQGVAFAQSHLARIARQDDDPQRAATLFTESARVSQEIGDDGRLAEALEGLAGALSDLGDMAEAARLFGAASALRERTDTPVLAVHLPAHERDLGTVQGGLGPERFQFLFREGAAVPPAQIPAMLGRWRPPSTTDTREAGVAATAC